VIVPALEPATWVCATAFTDASYAYQSGGSGVAWDKDRGARAMGRIRACSRISRCFSTSIPEIGRQRGAAGGTADRFEREERATFERVREAYLRRAAPVPIGCASSTPAAAGRRAQALEELCTPCAPERVIPW
jgi:dTMP kinase